MKTEEIDPEGFDDFDAWLANGGDSDLEEDAKPQLGTYTPDLFGKVFQHKNGAFKGIGLAFEKLTEQYKPEIIPFDPTFCFMFAHATALAISIKMGAFKGTYIDYPPVGRNEDFSDEDHTLTQSIWTDRISVPSKQSKKHIMTGRTLAYNASHLVIVDEFLEKGMHEEGQLMFLRFNEEHPDYVDAALIMDLTEGYKPYENVYLFAENRNRYKEFTDSFALKLAIRKLTPGFTDGGEEIPELV